MQGRGRGLATTINNTQFLTSRSFQHCGRKHASNLLLHFARLQGQSAMGQRDSLQLGGSGREDTFEVLKDKLAFKRGDMIKEGYPR